MEFELFFLEHINFRCTSVCKCVISRLSYYNKNFRVNINRNIGVLFNSIFFICKLDEYTSIYDSENFISFDNVSIVEFSNNIKYVGSIIDNKFNGKGKIYINDKLYYSGEFKNNLFHGKGILNSTYCDRYCGEFYEGNANGKCLIKWCNGNSFTGNIKDNVIDGYGTYKYKNGSYYVGNFSKGSKSGKGKFVIKTNELEIETESDNWTYDFLIGKGTIKCTEKSFNYAGDLKTLCLNNKVYLAPDGNGVIRNNIGKETYVGKFKNGFKNGMGYEYNHNGEKIYHGSFKNNYYEGTGILFDSDSELYTGDFKNGMMHGIGWIRNNNNTFELANFKYGKRFGQSVILDDNHKPITRYYYGDRIVSEQFSNTRDEKICAICLNDFVSKDVVTKLSNCNHIYHSKCLFEWLKINNTCPECRTTNLFEKIDTKKRKFNSD